MHILFLLCVNDKCSAGPTVVFIVCHSVPSSQPITVHTFILSLESFTTTCHTHKQTTTKQAKTTTADDH